MSNMFKNPIMARGADPWAYYHTDGNYYFMITLGNRIDLWRSSDLPNIASGERKTIWLPPAGGSCSCNLWAPEIHFIRGKWYVFFTANDGGGDNTRRICVLENEADDPMAGNWIERGAVNTQLAGLDGTVFEHRGLLYFLYAGYGHYPEYGSAIYIAEMDNPWTISGEERLLTKPEFDWEKKGGMAINEGPVMLRRNGKLFLLYSASTTWADEYCLGMLTAAEHSDPMQPPCWEKSTRPVFFMAAENNVFAPGHNSFTVSPDGTEDWIVYHAIRGSNGGAENRSTRIQPFGWRDDGFPDFGRPVAEDRGIAYPSRSN